MLYILYIRRYVGTWVRGYETSINYQLKKRLYVEKTLCQNNSHPARPNYQLSILNYQLNKGLYVSMSKKLSVENMNYVRQGLRSRSR